MLALSGGLLNQKRKIIVEEKMIRGANISTKDYRAYFVLDTLRTGHLEFVYYNTRNNSTRYYYETIRQKVRGYVDIKKGDKIEVKSSNVYINDKSIADIDYGMSGNIKAYGGYCGSLKPDWGDRSDAKWRMYSRISLKSPAIYVSTTSESGPYIMVWNVYEK